MKKNLISTIKPFLIVPKNERLSTFLLLSLLIAMASFPYWYQPSPPGNTEQLALQQQLAKLNELVEPVAQNDNEYSSKEYTNTNRFPEVYELFPFNPNTIDEAGWKKLGLSEKITRTILNYRSKGGRFYQPSDIRKIWGMPDTVAERLMPYIVLENNKKGNYMQGFTNGIQNKPLNINVLNINNAPAEELRKLPGLPYPLNYKIVQYRERLGGFLQVEQLKEVEGITDTIYQNIYPYLKLNKEEIRKIAVNKAAEYELQQHPYIGKKLATAIVFYRNKMGDYQSASDLKRIIFITPETIQKLLPYLKFE
ncbi:MAG: ComEA family DNA-binding protein [Chitinophagaceae bacterium]